MRRALIVVLAIFVLLMLDGVFNGYRISGGLLHEVQEFGRVVTRTLDEMF